MTRKKTAIGIAVRETGANGEPSQYDREIIGQQLDAFAAEHDLKSLRDRLRIGLNEVGVLAYEKTRGQIRAVCEKIIGDRKKAEQVYRDLLDMCVDIQEHGPWDYADELAESQQPETKAWYILAAAITMGYEKEMDLNEAEFTEHIQRIEGHLRNAINNPDVFFQTARQNLLERAKKTIRFAGDDEEKKTPIGEGLSAFLPMAVMGYQAGVVSDAEGWVYVGASGKITDGLLKSCGLKKQTQVADVKRDSKRTVDIFTNDKDQEVIKRLHRGFLVVLSRSFDLATAIAGAINDERRVLQVSDEDLEHTRVVQTTEGQLKEQGKKAEQDWRNFVSLKIPELKVLQDEKKGRPGKAGEMLRPKEQFYDAMHYIRGLYVYLDAVQKEENDLDRELTPHEREALAEKVWEKMGQKVDELRHVNGLIDKEFAALPESVHSVIDMAGGAGDLGLAVTTELLARGREINHTEIVDPQPGIAGFMETIIDYLPFRDDLKKIVEHKGVYLQDVRIRPDSMVVAKHACGTLTDDIIEMWRDSESPMLIAMTCCQDKAADHPARYGFEQEEWRELCLTSSQTNTIVPEEPGKARDKALRRLQQGKEAMFRLDMARVEYLRRHGFKARLSTTDKFPKGDVIIARRLPKNFMAKLKESRDLESANPVGFDNLMALIDLMSRGGDVEGKRSQEFGPEWVDDDFAELAERLSPVAVVKEQENKERRQREKNERAAAKEAAERERAAKELAKAEKEAHEAAEKRLFAEIFYDVEGKDMNGYFNSKGIGGRERGTAAGKIKKIIAEMSGQESTKIREAIDVEIAKMGY